MSNVFIDPVAAACLIHADEVLGEGPWQGTTPSQISFLENMPRFRAALNGLPPGIMEAIGSYDFHVVNQFLADRGWDMELDPPTTDDDFAVAVTLDALVHWAQPGESRDVWLPETREGVPGVKMRPQNFDAIEVGDHTILEPHIQQEGLRVLMVQSSSLEEGLRVINEGLETSSGRHRYKWAAFPMADFNERVDLTSLIGLSKGDAVIAQALAQAKLRINELGAHAQAAAAMAVMRSEPNDLTINGSYTMAFAGKNGVAVAFYVERRHFTRPESLGESDGPAPSQRRHRKTW